MLALVNSLEAPPGRQLDRGETSREAAEDVKRTSNVLAAKTAAFGKKQSPVPKGAGLCCWD